MKNCIMFSLPGNEVLADQLAKKLLIKIGEFEIRKFPDEESYIRIDSDVHNKMVLLIDGLEYPNSKILELMFVAKTLKELGASKICLISPYLPYMRQDKRFKPGEAVTSILFANLISMWINHLITIDPHLHRIKNLSEIYSIDSVSVLHSTKKIAEWIKHNIDSPFIIGPDEESQQWVGDIAKFVSAPYDIIKKTRQGDRSVTLTVPDIHINNKHVTIVLIDDIISTGTSMAAAIQQLLLKGFTNFICISVHALFNEETYHNLLNAGATNIITCNTIPHLSNRIDITELIIDEVIRLQRSLSK